LQVKLAIDVMIAGDLTGARRGEASFGVAERHG